MARTIISVLGLLVGLATANFLILRMVPGDPAVAILGEHATPEARERIREDLGLNDPAPVQWWRLVKATMTWDFGLSFRSKLPVSQELKRTFPVTVALALSSSFFSGLLGVLLGGLLAGRSQGWSNLAQRFLYVFQNLPNFLVGLTLVIIFAGTLNWFPVSGLSSPTGWVLPIVTLMIYPTILIARLTIQNLEQALQQDYVRTAVAKGVSPTKAKLFHALPNAMIPVVAALGSYAGALCSGAVMTETVFALPGVGRLMLQAVENRDLPLIQGTLTATVFLIFGWSLLADYCVRVLDPRSRT